jgi:hypothetical protein
MKTERHLFCIFLIYSILSFQNLEELRVELRKPPLKRRSWVKSSLAKHKSSTNPLLSHLFCPLHVGSVDVCATCWWEVSNVCLSCLRDLPHTYCCTYFYLTKKKTKKRQTRALPVETLGSLNFVIIIIIVLFLLFIILFCIFLICLILIFQNSEELRVELHKPPLKRRSWVRGSLAEPKI